MMFNRGIPLILLGLVFGCSRGASASELGLELAQKTVRPDAKNKVLWVLGSHSEPSTSLQDERHTETLVIQLPKELAPFFVGVSLAPERPKALKASYLLQGQMLTVQLVDTGIGTYFHSEVPLRFFGLQFSKLPVGVHAIDFASADFTGSSGARLTHWQFKSSRGTIAVTPPGFTTSSLLREGFLGRYYSEVLEVGGLVQPLSFRVSRGSLPSGLVLSAKTGALGGIPTQKGTHAFTVTVTDAEGTQVSSSFALKIVDPIVQPEAAFFWDKDLSGGASPGDEIRLAFDGPVQLGPSPELAILPRLAGENFGSGATFASEPGGRQVSITLGRSPLLSNPTGGGGVSIVNPGSAGIRDVAGNPINPSQLPFEWYSSRLGRVDWFVGQPIEPIWVGDPGAQVQDLPPGLVYSKGVIAGTPTLPAKGEVSVLSKPDDEQVQARFPFSVLPQGTQGLFVSDPIPQAVLSGSLLALDIFAADPTVKTEVTIGGQRLIPLPTTSGGPSFYWLVPDGAPSGPLQVTQPGRASFSGPYIQVIPRNQASGTGLRIDDASVIQSKALGRDFVHISGGAFYLPEVEANGIPLRVIHSDASSVLAELEPGTPDGRLDLQVTNSSSRSSVLGLLGNPSQAGVSVQKGKPELPPNVPGPAEGIKAQREAFEKIMAEVNRRIGLDGARAKNGTLYFWYVCFHESAGFKYREQICNGGKPGPGTGIPQMEPTTVADTIDRNCKNKKLESRKACCEAIQEAARDLTDDQKAGQALLEEADRILSGKSNKWPKNSLIETIMKKNPSGDLLSLILARCKENLNSSSLPDADSETYISDISHYWARHWWIGAKPGTSKYNDQVKKFGKDAQRADRALSE